MTVYRPYPKSAIDLHLLATETFHAAAKELLSSIEPSDYGAAWRSVKRLPLDTSIPSGLEGGNLLIPAIDTGFDETVKAQSSQSLEASEIRSHRKGTAVKIASTSPEIASKKAKTQSDQKAGNK